MKTDYSKTYIKMIGILNKMDDKEYMESFLSYNTSLICAGLKPAVTLTLITINSRNLYDLLIKYGEFYIDKLNLNYAVLRQNKDSAILIIYNQRMLSECLNKKCNADFLKTLGYKENAVLSDKLRLLREKYEIYKCPHELGIFLGYPVEDVASFMNDSKKECRLCGYWKAYNNEEEAERIFELYDKVKNCSAQNIIKGFSEKQMAKNNYRLTNNC